MRGAFSTDLRLRAIGWLLVQLEEFVNIYSFKDYSVNYVVGIHTNTFQGILVNVFSILVQTLTQKRAIHPHALCSSQYCEYFFSTLGEHSYNQTSALPATRIDIIMARGILTRLLQMKLGKRFSFLHSKNPIYLEDIPEEGEGEEEIGEESCSVITNININIPNHPANLKKVRCCIFIPKGMLLGCIKFCAYKLCWGMLTTKKHFVKLEILEN